MSWCPIAGGANVAKCAEACYPNDDLEFGQQRYQAVNQYLTGLLVRLTRSDANTS